MFKIIYFTNVCLPFFILGGVQVQLQSFVASIISFMIITATSKKMTFTDAMTHLFSCKYKASY
jgi:hypothetical protein